MTNRKPPLALEHLEFTRQLRQSATDAENLLWRHLRGRQLGGCKFRRQHPLSPYVLDFFCEEKRLAIELDGGQHYSTEGIQRDLIRDQWIAEKGIQMLRFSNREVLVELEAVLTRILLVVQDSLFVEQDK